MKIVILIIASDNEPIYRELQKVWRAYMHSDPDHIEAYFLKADPTLTEEVCVVGEVIWVRGCESLVPGIINKTVRAFQGLIEEGKEFTHVLRTNLSSFFVFSRLLKVVKELPKERCYAGVSYELFASGAGYILSRDMVELVVKNQALLRDNIVSADDAVLGWLLRSEGIEVIPLPRSDGEIGEHFHFRMKEKELRLELELPKHWELVRKFY